MSIPIKYKPDTTAIEGLSPIIVLGPNGSGKTRYGLELAAWNNAEDIAALRNIALEKDVPMQSTAQAEEALNRQKRGRKKRPWNISSEINHLFAKLMAEDSGAAVEFRDRYSDGEPPRQTKLMTLQKSWQELFPGRRIEFGGYTPRVTSEYVAGGTTYPAQSMSDGERVALYLAGRVLDAPPGVVVVDEPEVHFHSRLAIQFWDELERLRQDCRFVYITHDLTFARSRRTKDYIITRPGQDPQLASMDDGLPEEVTKEILSAASFSIYANTVIFCEGTESSYDQQLFRAWYKDRHYAVVPVGSCRDVLNCTNAFQTSNLVDGLSAIGIVDRDYWPDAFVQSVPVGVTMLPHHEIESLLCDKGVAFAVAKHLGKSDDESETLYAEFVTEAVGKFTGGLLNHQVSERFKRRCESQVDAAMNALRAEDDEAALRANHCTALAPNNWSISPETVFDEEMVRIKDALAAPYADVLGLLPGKVYFSILVSKLGMTKSTYVELLARALKEDVNLALMTLGNEIRAALEDVLPNG